MGTLHAGGTVGAMLITAIERFADRPAIADNFTRWTYRDLGDAAGRLSAIFRARGLKTGDGVALIATNRVETWAVVTAAAVMGLRYTPLHPLAAEDDHASIVEDAEIDALIVEGGKFAERGRALQSRVPDLKHLMKRSLWKMLSLPSEASNRSRGAMRGGLWSSSSLPGAGICTRFDLYPALSHEVKPE